MRIIEIFYSDADQCYFAQLEKHPNINAFGDSPLEALEELTTVLSLLDFDWFKEMDKTEDSHP